MEEGGKDIAIFGGGALRPEVRKEVRKVVLELGLLRPEVWQRGHASKDPKDDHEGRPGMGAGSSTHHSRCQDRSYHQDRAGQSDYEKHRALFGARWAPRYHHDIGLYYYQWFGFVRPTVTVALMVENGHARTCDM